MFSAIFLGDILKIFADIIAMFVEKSPFILLAGTSINISSVFIELLISQLNSLFFIDFLTPSNKADLKDSNKLSTFTTTFT